MKQPQSIHTGSVGNSKSAPQLPLHEGEGVKHGGNTNATSYSAAQCRAAECLRQVRELVTQLDMLPESNRTEYCELSQRIRRAEREAKLELQAAKEFALAERRQQEFELLSRQFKSTVNLVRERCGGGLPAGRLDDKNVHDTSSSPTRFKEYPEESGVFQRERKAVYPHGYDIRDDGEFMQFFEGVQKKDVIIDDALDRIYSGVQRLNGDAMKITSELHVQEQMLEETEQNVDRTQGKLGRLNAKLREAFKKMDRPMLALYVVCCLLLVGVIVAIYFMAKQ